MGEFTNKDLSAMYKRIYDRTAKDLHDIAHVKRYLERITGDAMFRDGILSGLYDLSESAKDSGCDIDPQSLLPIFHPDFSRFRNENDIGDWPLAELWNGHYTALCQFRDQVRACADSRGLNVAYDSWRQRQITRVELDVGVQSMSIVHAPVAFELSGGCSVGCWFCGVAAERFRGHFRTANGGIERWTDVLREVQSVIGDALGNSFLYWATDPLDNPDYVDIIRAFRNVTGIYPQMTTAIPLKNVALTRAVLELWHEDKCYPNRFSILNNKILQRVHAEFTAEELVGTELVLQNNESTDAAKIIAGRALAEKNTPRGLKKQTQFAMSPGTIACVSGFLINIFDKTIKMVSPCSATEQYDKGYITFDEQSYSAPNEIAGIMQVMIGTRMRQTLAANMTIRLSPNFARVNGEAANSIHTPSAVVQSPAVSLVSRYVDDNDNNVIDVVRRAVGNGEDPFFVIDAIDRCRNAGVLDYVA